MTSGVTVLHGLELVVLMQRNILHHFSRPIKLTNARYGTFDHLVLLMGRLADFAAKDLKRKRLAMKANGGNWRPPETIQMQNQAGPQGQPPLFPQVPQQPL